MEQLTFRPDPVDAAIEAVHAQHQITIKRMADEAREFINRSCGQRARYLRERIERETEEFWQQRNT